MNIYQSTEVRPYIYICTHKTTGEFYIGSRYYNVTLKCVSNLDFPKYKTSSKIVRPDFDNYTWIIYAEFFDNNSAYDAEQQLIFDNWNNPLLLNKHCHYGKSRFNRSSPPSNKGTTGLVKHSNETKALIRSKRALQVTTYSTKEKISNSLLGNTRSKKPRSNETKQKIKESLANTYKLTPKVLGMLGKQHSPETKEKMRLAQQARRANK